MFDFKLETNDELELNDLWLMLPSSLSHCDDLSDRGVKGCVGGCMDTLSLSSIVGCDLLSMCISITESPLFLVAAS